MTRQEKAEIDEEITDSTWLNGEIETILEGVQGKLARARTAKTRTRLKDRIRSIESALNKVRIRLSDLEY